MKISKQIQILVVFLLCSLHSSAQLERTVHAEAGHLSEVLKEEANKISQLTVIGSLNKLDFGAINEMPILNNLDLSQVIIEEYHDELLYPALTLPSNCFKGNNNLVKVLLPLKTIRIDDGCFAGCGSLEFLQTGEMLTSIGSNALNSCKSLRKIDLPETIESIGDRAFEGCQLLETIPLLKNLKTLGNAAFAGCSSISSVEFAPEMEQIGSDLFKGCYKLISASLPAKLNNIPQGAFSGCTNLTSITIPDNTVSIGTNAFANTGLTHLIIPPSVQTLDDYFVSGCNQLRYIRFLKDAPPPITSTTFAGINNETCLFYVPQGTYEDYYLGFTWFGHYNIKEMYLYADKSYVSLPAYASEQSLDIYSNTDWAASSDQSWVNASPSGSWDGQIVINAQPNASTTERTAIITVHADAVSTQYIQVVQEPSMTTGINQNQTEISIFPNPATDVINILNARNSHATLINMQGQIVKNLLIENDNTQLRVANLARGFYILKTGSKIQQIILK